MTEDYFKEFLWDVLLERKGTITIEPGDETILLRYTKDDQEVVYDCRGLVPTRRLFTKFIYDCHKHWARQDLIK